MKGGHKHFRQSLDHHKKIWYASIVNSEKELMGTPNTNPAFIGKGIGIEASARNGYKVICIQVSETGEYNLLSPHYSNLVAKLDDDSRCGLGKKHGTSESFSSCTCGFYGYFTPANAIDHRRNNANESANFFVAQAAYSGEVVIAEHGMRSTHQRIRKIFLDKCWNCSNDGTTLALHEAGVLVAACEPCGEKVATVGPNFPCELVPASSVTYFEIEDKLSQLSYKEKIKLKNTLEDQINSGILDSL